MIASDPGQDTSKDEQKVWEAKRDGIQPNHEQILQLCLFNAETINGDFQHNSILWLPISLPVTKKSEFGIPSAAQPLLGGMEADMEAAKTRIDLVSSKLKSLEERMRQLNRGEGTPTGQTSQDFASNLVQGAPSGQAPPNVASEDEPGKEKWWYSVKVQWKNVKLLPGVKSEGRFNIKEGLARFLLDRQDVTKFPIRIPGSSHLCFYVHSKSALVKDKIEKEYEGHGAGGNEDEEYKLVKKHIIEVNKEEVRKAVQSSRLTSSLESMFASHRKRLNDRLHKIEKGFGILHPKKGFHREIGEKVKERSLEDGDPEDDPDEPSLSDFITDVSSALGHSADRGYLGPAYEELYLSVHSILYFGFFAMMFCVMLTVSTYILMQFFFMFLDHQQDSGYDQSWRGGFAYFLYFFLIPYLLITVSVVGYQVMLMIQSTVQTSQLTRARALIVGIVIEYLKRRTCWRQFKWEDYPKDNKDACERLFWRVLKHAVGIVDMWFTVGMDVCMVLGCILASTVMDDQQHVMDSFWMGSLWKTAGLSLLLTFIFLVWMRFASVNYALFQWEKCDVKDFIKLFHGRMLNWKTSECFTMIFVIWLGVVFIIQDSAIAYAGVVIGGVFWAMLTTGLYILSDTFLGPKQRDLMTVLEMCINDIAIRAGRMEVRFHEVKCKMEQQIVLGDANMGAFNLNKEVKNTLAMINIILGYVVLLMINIILGYGVSQIVPDPFIYVPGLLIIDGMCLAAISKIEANNVEEDIFDKVKKLVLGIKNMQAFQYVGRYSKKKTFLYVVFAHIAWLAPYFLGFFEFKGSNASWFFFGVVLVVAVMLLHATLSPFPPLLVLVFTVVPYVVFQTKDETHDDDSVYQALQSAYPALFLMPAMVYWHKVVVRWIPSISHGHSSGIGKRMIHSRLPKFNGYHGLMLFYIIFSVTLFLGATVLAQAAIKVDDVKEMGMYVGGSGPIHNDTMSFTYPVCKLKYGPPELNLGVLDLAILSKYAYSQDTSVLREGINRSFGIKEGFWENHGSVELVVNEETGNASDFTDLPRIVTTKFISKSRADGENDTTYVVAFKGTSTPKEAFADGSFYSGVALLGFISQFIDIFDLVPNRVLASLLDGLRIKSVKEKEDKMLMVATKYIQELKRKTPKAHIVITGHSLGGGFALALAGITEHNALTFSAPGTHFNRFVFKTNFERSWRNVVNIWPDYDWVPLVDRHDEMVQRIACRDAKTGSHRSHIGCHLMTSTICELWRVCGDQRGRAMTVCTENYTANDTYWGQYIRPTGSIGRFYNRGWDGRQFDGGRNRRNDWSNPSSD